MSALTTSLMTGRAGETLRVICILAFAGLIRMPSLAQPLGPDQGIMAVIGSGILHGKLPYRDFWEMASPAIFYTYALMFKLFGTTMMAIPICDTLVSMITTLLIYALGKSLWGKNAGYLSAIIFALFSNGARLGMHSGGDVAFGTFWYIAQRETFMLPLLAASMLLVVGCERDGKKSWRILVSGFLAGVVFLYKFPSLVVSACLLLYLNWGTWRPGNRHERNRRIRKNTAFLTGFALAIIPVIAYFAANGVLREMNDIVFRYVYSVYGQMRHDLLSTVKLGLSRTLFIGKEQLILWVFFPATSIYLVVNERNRENLLVVAWAATAVLFVISHSEFFGYHYLMILPPFSLLAGWGIIRIFGHGGEWKRFFWKEPSKTIVITAILANVLFYATFIHSHYTKYYFYLTQKISKEQYYSFFTAYPAHDYSFAADYAVAQYVKEHTSPSDKIYSLGGIESVIYFLTERESPSRFIFSWILFFYAHGRTPMAERYRSELLDDLKRDTPALIVTVRPLENFRQYRELYDYLTENFVLVKTFFDDRYVYRKK